MRFPQYLVVHTCEPASFWRENAIAVVILLLVFSENVAEVTETSYEMLKVLLFCDGEKAYYYLHHEANGLLPTSVK